MDLSFEKSTLFLVTGGAGFIGSNICEEILRLGCKVRCLDNLSTGKKENVDLFINNDNYEFIKGDIRDLETCKSACEGVDYVIHQAAWGSVPRSIELPLEYEQVNIMGTLNMLEAAKINKVKKFVYASSSAVYGDDSAPQKKEGIEGKLLSPYALTKRVDEEYAKLYTDLYGLETYGLRYFNVYGKRQDPNGMYAAVIPKFIKHLLNNEIPVIYGDGKQSRDFVFVLDVVEANLKCCLADSSEAGQVYNVASGKKEELIDIFNVLVKALDKDIKPKFEQERIGDIKHSSADITKIKERLKYNPQYNFEKGIEMAIEWYKNNL